MFNMVVHIYHGIVCRNPAMLGYIIHPTGDPTDKTGAVRERDRNRYRDRELEKENREKGHSVMLGYIIHTTGDPKGKTGATSERQRKRVGERKMACLYLVLRNEIDIENLNRTFSEKQT